MHNLVEHSPTILDESLGSPAVLRLVNVDKSYPGVRALKEVSLEVQPGEVHAIVGENGAGKSTLVGVAAGSVTPDSGTVEICGITTEDPSPTWSRSQGLAIVYQEPALLPDLTVAESMRLATPEDKRPAIKDQVAWAGEVLSSWSQVARIDPRRPVRDLAPDARFVAELARAITEKPQVVILDEPTEHLLPEAVEELFTKIEELISQGTAVVYISHKIKEVKRVAHRVSVLRDGRSEGTHEATDLSEQNIVDLVVGRENEVRRDQVTKRSVAETEAVRIQVSDLAGKEFSNVNFEVRTGEIVGFAGIEGQGQREVMRAVAGLVKSTGEIRVRGNLIKHSSAGAAHSGGIGYIPHDRKREGTFPGLSLHENAAVSALGSYSKAGVIRNEKITSAITKWFHSLRVKAPNREVHIETLSGGNQQKVVLSRILLEDSEVILADEPTQGVDVGARAEIYEILRDAADRGAAVIVLSSSAVELEEICNRVLVFSSGQIVAELSEGDVVERQITSAALMASKHRESQAGRSAAAPKLRTKEKFFGSDLLPAVILLVLILLLGVIAGTQNEYYLTIRNFGLMLPLIATLGFFALAQQFAMMVGGIDISVGPLASFLVVVGSFVITVDHTAFGVGVGIVILTVLASLVGTVNWFLISIIKITPLIATLITFTALQGFAFLLRPLPGGVISVGMRETVTARIGFVPIAFIVVVVVAVLLEIFLRRSIFGVKLRAVGSDRAVAQRVGVRSNLIQLGAYVATSVMVVPAALLLMAQAGTGNSTIGDTYVLSSIGAAVLGGASLFGGRGSFVGVLLGAALVVQANSFVQFIGLNTYWQMWVIGGLTLVAAATYSKIRSQSQVIG